MVTGFLLKVLTTARLDLGTPACASELIAANVPTVVVKDFLGHASVTTTETYYCNTKPSLRAAANARKVRLEDEGPKGDGPKAG